MQNRSIAWAFIGASFALLASGCGGADGTPMQDAAVGPDGSMPLPDGAMPLPDGSTPLPDGNVPVPDGNVPVPDGNVPVPDGNMPTPDGSAPLPDAGPPPTTGVTVSGNHLLEDGAPFQIRGVNRSGTEYACIQGWGLFDGPSDDASLAAITAWGANAIRIPMNETCWLGINGAPAAYSGSAYQDAILAYAARVEAHGMVPILELHWSAPGAEQATGQNPMPDRDHSVDFWRGVASAVAGDPYAVLELFNEPYPDNNSDTSEAWRCWRDGGTCAGVSYTAAGMQELVDAVRATGAHNVLLLGGVEYSNSLSQWLAHEPDDPLGQLAAAWHIYNFNLCSDSSCFDGAPATVAAAVPIVATEIGEDDCSGSFISNVMGWLDGHGDGYLAWTWDTWSGCLVLIDDYAGTPDGTYGTTYRDHLLSLAP